VITLFDGQRYEGVPGERKFRIVRFAENSIPVRLPALSGGAVALEGVGTGVLLSSTDLKQHAELHFRLAFPIMALVLGIVGVPLAKLRPRQGRYARVGFAVLIFFVLGLWWVHAAVGLLAASILLVPPWLARANYRRNMSRLVASGAPA
jgi:lipopolysaccharide export system permease protein